MLDAHWEVSKQKPHFLLITDGLAQSPGPGCWTRLPRNLNLAQNSLAVLFPRTLWFYRAIQEVWGIECSYKWPFIDYQLGTSIEPGTSLTLFLHILFEIFFKWEDWCFLAEAYKWFLRDSKYVQLWNGVLTHPSVFTEPAHHWAHRKCSSAMVYICFWNCRISVKGNECLLPNASEICRPQDGELNCGKWCPKQRFIKWSVLNTRVYEYILYSEATGSSNSSSILNS